ncbi:MAG: hypothetical protein P1P90_06030 [Patescibacteria group bacterium]|nr:hypothetical protein [Patescibacteria group bacterium]
MNLKKILVIAFLFLFTVPMQCLAYEPILLNYRAVYEVSDPLVAREYYSRLGAGPMRFRLVYEEPGDLDVTILIPDIPDAAKNVTGLLKYVDENGERQDLELSAKEDEWSYYRDDFSGNAYYLGPEAHVKVASGTHLLVVESRPDNEKPFVLKLGSEEDSSIEAKFRTMIEMGKVKNDVYSEFPLLAYNNFYGILLLIPFVLVVGLVVYLAIKTYLRIKKADEEEERKSEQASVNESENG